MIVFEEIIAKRVGVPVRQVKNTIELLEEGATIPFISRYRKEHTGSLDEVKITEIRDELNKLKELERRKEYILKTINEQEKLTDELKGTDRAVPRPGGAGGHLPALQAQAKDAGHGGQGQGIGAAGKDPDETGGDGRGRNR